MDEQLRWVKFGKYQPELQFCTGRSGKQGASEQLDTLRPGFGNESKKPSQGSETHFPNGILFMGSSGVRPSVK
ncbi:hypothetical protein HAX54_047602 [Datura stramonium]|uniref:Uncharacterized protein n=1 Tax=Datura stramonium TaxID=4076 RepID=A0ABS8SSN2_DATST|nr:hypothetical protein [Datura stramonium]